MAAATGIRWSGLAAILSGVLWVGMLIETATRPAHPQRGPLYPLVFATFSLIALSLPGIHLRQRQRAGRLSVLGLGLTYSGLLFIVVARLAVDYLALPALTFFVSVLILIVGLVTFLISMLRAGVLSHAATALLLGGTMALVVFNFGDARIWLGLSFGIAWIWLGAALALYRRDR